ncbi:hypothetical protein BH09BAC5_BH09BAC5_24660 [soil metagenome]
MKKVMIFAGFVLVFAMGACNNSPAGNKNDAETVQYTCPMHPEVISDKPGSCPKCGMDLEKVESGHEHTDSTMHH